MYQNKTLVIEFIPGRGANALHMDEFPLSFLGKMEVGRASTIDFNQETQLFDVMLKDATRYTLGEGSCPSYIGVYDQRHYACHYPQSALGFTGYDEGRGYEVAWIQECKLLGVDPLDPEGIEVINRLREESGSPQL